VPFGAQIGTGTYSTQEMTAQDAVLTELDVGTKYLQCDVAGTIAIPNKNMPGEIEFYVNKWADDNVLRLLSVSSGSGVFQTTEGYMFQINSNEGLHFIRSNIGSFDILSVTANAYTAIQTWYGIKETWTPDGEHTTWIKGGAFGNTYTAIVTNPIGNNPITDATYTTTEYIVADMDALDKIILMP